MRKETVRIYSEMSNNYINTEVSNDSIYIDDEMLNDQNNIIQDFVDGNNNESINSNKIISL